MRGRYKSETVAAVAVAVVADIAAGSYMADAAVALKGKGRVADAAPHQLVKKAGFLHTLKNP